MPIEKPIGLVNKKTGKRWAGENYGEQSQESYDKLLVAGKLNPVQQGIDRFGNYLTTSAKADPIVGPVLKFLGAGVRTITNVLPKPIKQGVGFVLEKNQEAAENIAAATGLPVSLTDPMTIADAVMGGAVTATRPAVKTAVRETLQGAATIGRNLPPPGPQLVPVGAGSAPRVQLNVSRGKANLQVMEARAKPGMTQAQMDTQQGAEIRLKRTKVEDAKAAMENIEASNPGVPKNVLKDKDMGGFINEKGKYTDGYKSHQRRYEDGMAEISSAESNIVVPTTDNPYAFPRDTPGAKQFKEEVGIANEALGRAVEQLELHHLIPKGMSAAIYNRARDFIEKGLVDPKYLNRIAEKFKKITGADTGDLRSGILPMRNTPHKTYHNEMRFQPSDTFPGENMEIMKEALTTKLNKINNPKDFEILLDNLIKNDIKPLVDNARIWEKSDDVIRSVSPDFTGRALPNVLKKRKVAAKKTRQKTTNK